MTQCQNFALSILLFLLTLIHIVSNMKMDIFCIVLVLIHLYLIYFHIIFLLFFHLIFVADLYILILLNPFLTFHSSCLDFYNIDIQFSIYHLLFLHLFALQYFVVIVHMSFFRLLFRILLLLHHFAHIF